MTLCNMAIEAGARAGMVAVDDTTIDYVKGRPYAPKAEQWDAAVVYWRTLHSDEGAKFDAVVDCVAHLLHVDLGDDVEGRHQQMDPRRATETGLLS